MVRFSVVLEGDKQVETYLSIARVVDGAGFYSMQFYEHTPYRPAWGTSFIVASHVKNVLLGPVTVPANLYTPSVNARFLAYLQSIGPGAVLGISRGAYTGRASIRDVVGKVVETVAELRRITWARPFNPIIYVGTSGPILAKAASRVAEVTGIVVDNLANPGYASEMRRTLDEAGGKDKELVARPFTFLSDDPDMVWSLFYKELKRYVVELVDGSPMMKFAGLTVEDLARDDDRVRRRVLECFAVYGSVDDILEKAARLLRAGVSHICFGHPIAPDPVEGCKKLSKIIPILQEEFGIDG